MSTAAFSTDRLALRAGEHRGSMAIYGAAHFGKSLFWFASETIFGFYLTEVAGLSAVVMGMVIASGLVVAAMLDPLVDRIFARRLATVHGCATLQWLGACASAASLTPMFLSYHVPEAGRLGFVVVTGLAFRVTYAVYDQAQNALIGRATVTERDRTAVAAMRVVLSGLAALTIAAIAACLAFGGSFQAGRSGAHFAVVSVLLSACAVGSATMLHAIRGPVPLHVFSGGHRVRFQDRLPPTVWMPLGIAFTTAAVVPFFAKTQPYLVRYCLEAPLWGALLGGAVPLGGMLSQPLWARLSRSRPRQDIFLMAAAVLSSAAVMFWLTAAMNPLGAILAAASIGIGSGGLTLTMWAALGDAIVRPAGQPGWGFGFLTASSKLGLAVGAIAFGVVLDRMNYRGSHGAGLITIMALGPLIGGVCGVLIVLGGGCLSRRSGRATIMNFGLGTLALAKSGIFFVISAHYKR